MNEKSISEFLNEMASVGFDFIFTATDGKDIYRGEGHFDKETNKPVIKAKKQLTADELKDRIKARLK